MNAPRRLALWIGGGLLLVAAAVALAAWWWHTHERVEEWIDLPRTGEARSNPLHALKLALGRDGVPAQSRRRLDLDDVPLRARDTVLLHNDPRTLPERDVARLLAWVEGGGHLLVRTPPPGLLGNDGAVPLLDALDVRMLDGSSGDSLPDDSAPDDSATRDSQCARWQVPGEDSHVEFCRGRRFTLAGANPRRSWGDLVNGYVFARVPRGRGTVDVLADVDFLTTAQLDEGPHLVLARQLLAPNYRAGTVHLVHAAEMPSLWATLLRAGWMAWAPLLLALLAWLWTRMQRFGPLLPPPQAERRSLLEHVTASGEHGYRYGYGHRLHEAVRDAFLARLRRRDPVAAALDGDAQAALIAARLGVAPEEIREALTAPFPRDHAAFRHRIATLIRLRNRL